MRAATQNRRRNPTFTPPFPSLPLCAGDDLAAEFLLLLCVARVHGRPGGDAVGSVAIAFSHAPAGDSRCAHPHESMAGESLCPAAAAIATCLAAVHSRSHVQPLTRAWLNAGPIVPVKVRGPALYYVRF